MSQKSEQGSYLFLVLWKAFRAAQKIDEKSIQSLGLGCHSDFAILEALLHKGPLPVNQLGSIIGLTSGSITTAVQRLEKKTWVQRETSPIDARIIVISLTPTGQTTISEAFDVHAKNLERIFAPLSRSEKATLADLLKRTGKSAQLIHL